MKVRNGFVSNSSSSSFIIIGEECEDFYSITEEMLKTERFLVVGKELSEGSDVFELTPDILKLFSKFGYIPWAVWKPILTIFEYEKISKNIFPDDKEYGIYIGEKDYHSSENFQDILERYVPEDYQLKKVKYRKK